MALPISSASWPSGFSCLAFGGIDQPHHIGAIACTGRGANGEQGVEHLEIVGGQGHLGCGDVVFEVAPALGSRDRDDVPAGGQDPREGELGRGTATGLGSRAEGGDPLLVRLEPLLRHHARYGYLTSR